MVTEHIQRLYDRALLPESDWTEHQALIEALLERHDRERVAYHYELLRDRAKRRLYLDLRSAFKKHGPAAEAFLLEVFPRESSPRMRADALLVLGLLRSKEARRLALESITADDEELRHKACVVLGWVGTARDMETVLRERLLRDPSALVRGDTASAYRQVWYRMPQVKEAAERDFAAALASEEDEYAVGILVISLQTIARRRFGLRETEGEVEIVGDVGEAKVRALRYLERYVRG